jgi:hypothetical protein
MSKADELAKLKKILDDAKTESNKTEGELKVLLEDLEINWGFKNEQDADKKSDEMLKEISNLNTKLDEYMRELEQKYEL